MFSTFSVSRSSCIVAFALAAVVVPAPAQSGKPAGHEFRVCADPNSLPFSNRREQGFENELARLIAAELGMPVRYYWWPQRRGFIRNTLNSGMCDVVMGVPSNYELAQTTRPYYRSMYVFVSRRDRHLRITSLNDSRLAHLHIGIHTIGDDYSNIPPAQALASRGLAANIRGYSVYGDYSQENPPARLIEAVARGDVDVAIVWGPLAGYFAQRASIPLEILPVRPDSFSFGIAMGVRRQDTALKQTLDRIISAREHDIQKLLQKYGVPLAAAPEHSRKGT